MTTYYVSYQGTIDYATMIGSCAVTLTTPIRSMADVNTVKKLIEGEPVQGRRVTSVVVLNWIELPDGAGDIEATS